MASKKREEAHLEELESRLMEALKLRRDGQTEKATEELRYILKVEPRLAEPRMELASIALQSGQWEEAEAQAGRGRANPKERWAMDESSMKRYYCHWPGIYWEKPSDSKRIVTKWYLAVPSDGKS